MKLPKFVFPSKSFEVYVVTCFCSLPQYSTGNQLVQCGVKGLTLTPGQDVSTCLQLFAVAVDQVAIKFDLLFDRGPLSRARDTAAQVTYACTMALVL